MTKDRPVVGLRHELEDGIACILAPNASPMTHWGTNTYILGHDRVTIIDPGPADTTHLSALLKAINGRVVEQILITHSHLDHSPLARTLADKTGAPVLAFGDSNAGRSDVMAQFQGIGGGEGVDHDFAPDVCLATGDQIETDGQMLTALHTPGHFGNHLSFLSGEVAFTGDHLMGWATSLVSPPDGDLTDFMASCHALAGTGIIRAYSGHGAPILDAQMRLSDVIAHRLTREAEILSALQAGPATPASLTALIYIDLASALIPMAKRNVLAHLIDLTMRGITESEGALSAEAKFTLT